MVTFLLKGGGSIQAGENGSLWAAITPKGAEPVHSYRYSLEPCPPVYRHIHHLILIPTLSAPQLWWVRPCIQEDTAGIGTNSISILQLVRREKNLAAEVLKFLQSGALNMRVIGHLELSLIIKQFYRVKIMIHCWFLPQHFWQYWW